MKKVGNTITLAQGDLYFGEAPGVIATLLGSCVAVTLWHPRLHVGGMCHVVVPQRLKGNFDHRYPCCATDQFVKEIAKYNTRAADYEVGLYGGGNMFPGIKIDKKKQVGQNNILRMEGLMNESGFNLSEFHVGGNTYRKVSLCLNSGEVIVSGHDVQASGVHQAKGNII